MHTYNLGDIAYLIESNRYIMEGKIIRRSGDLLLLRFTDGGGTRVHADRLFPTEEAAQAYLDRLRSSRRRLSVMAFG